MMFTEFLRFLKYFVNLGENLYNHNFTGNGKGVIRSLFLATKYGHRKYV